MFFKQFCALFVALALISCTLAAEMSMTQSLSAAWKDGDKDFSMWEVTATNVCGKTIRDAVFVAESNFNLRNVTGNDIWGVEPTSKVNRFHFPAYISERGIAHNASIKFGYVNKGTASATFSICEVQTM
ncbi:hypothetical protein CYY_002513 [Polysphondylium violaceum]|uniref:Carbohydrate binding domain-containing protein n=1 Tax=Polysphondylium violaceum TaxID=133409 RepID=A0A8J4PZ72_9MYCE|nr:hypothetical protein CYY_002513 [Polysphondylium violaceum]